ncbi:MAG: hypothetical protein ACN4GK_05370 [Acidimicrobiia bacterium]
MAKRARERARQERQEEKRLRRESIAEATATQDAPNEDALMEEFRLLSERRAAGNLSDDLYEEERHRIFVELGLETDDDR